MKIKKEYLIAFLGLFLGGAVIFLARQIPNFPARREPGPSFFPYLTGILLVIVGAGQAFEGIKSSNYLDIGIRDKDKNGVKNVFFLIFMTFLYIIGFKKIGFAETTFLFLVLILNMLQAGLAKSLIISAILVTVIYYLFGILFRVPLPSGLLFRFF